MRDSCCGQVMDPAQDIVGRYRLHLDAAHDRIRELEDLAWRVPPGEDGGGQSWRELAVEESQSRLVAEEELQRLRSWEGLMSLLDAHYPPDIFGGASGDPGPRIVALTRQVDRLRRRMDAALQLLEAVDDLPAGPQQLIAQAVEELRREGETADG